MNGLEIKKRRQALGMTQSELAARVRNLSGRTFSQQALGKLESSDKSESRLMHYIIRVLDEAEGGSPPPPPPGTPSAQSPVLSAKEEEIIAIYRMVTEFGRQTIYTAAIGAKEDYLLKHGGAGGGEGISSPGLSRVR